jgi:hypothetical protein
MRVPAPAARITAARGRETGAAGAFDVWGLDFDVVLEAGRERAMAETSSARRKVPQRDSRANALFIA